MDTAARLIAAIVLLMGTAQLAVAAEPSIDLYPVPQSSSLPDWWRLKEASATAALAVHEITRSRVNGTTVVTVRFDATSFPSDRRYEFWASSADGVTAKLWDVKADPKGDLALVRSDGTFVLAFTDWQMTLGEFVKGERMDFALVSTDRTVRAFTKFVPFPLEARQGRCRISLELLTPTGTLFVAQGEGFEPDEELESISHSDGEVIGRKVKASADGKIGPDVIMPAAVQRRYKSNWTVKGRSCTVSLDYAWGPQALVKQ